MFKLQVISDTHDLPVLFVPWRHGDLAALVKDVAQEFTSPCAVICSLVTHKHT